MAAQTPAVSDIFEEVIVGCDGYYRPGHMTPVWVKLANHSPVSFAELVAVQNDDDGDQIHWHAAAVVPPGQTAWHSVLVCPRPDALTMGKITLAVVDQRGQTAGSLVIRDGLRLADGNRQMRVYEFPIGARVVGVVGPDLLGFGLLMRRLPDVSPASIGRLANVGELPAVVSLPYERFPASWQGLDAIDVLYWDDGEPSLLNDSQQVALAEWVRRGGQLVIGLGSHAGDLAASPTLSSLLPVDVQAVGQTAPDLHGLGEWLLGRSLYRQVGQPLWQQTAAVRVSPRPGAIRLDAPSSRSPATTAPAPPPLAFRRAADAGSVTTISTSLRESHLVATLERADSTSAMAASALAKLVNFELWPRPVGGIETHVTRSLGAHLDSAGVGGTLISLVVLLSLGYAALAGPGVWLYLRYRGKTHLSWWVFAAAAIVATLASALLTAFNIKGASVSQFLVLDLAGGSNQAVARGYFGLYEPAHRRIAMNVKDDGQALLTPMIDAYTGQSTGYPDVMNYDLSNARLAAVEGVPIRRTIKRFELNWRGTVDGSVIGQVELGQGLDANVKLANQLPVELNRAVLVYAPPNPLAPPQVVTIGRLPVGKQVEIRIDQSRRETLDDYFKSLHSFLGLEGFAAMSSNVTTRDPLSRVILLSLMQRYPQPAVDQEGLNPRLARSLWSRMDRSELLRPGKALLIAEAQGYLPADIEFEHKNVDIEGPIIVRVLLDTKLP